MQLPQEAYGLPTQPDFRRAPRVQEAASLIPLEFEGGQTDGLGDRLDDALYVIKIYAPAGAVRRSGGLPVALVALAGGDHRQPLSLFRPLFPDGREAFSDLEEPHVARAVIEVALERV